jgi:hypothetical protein
MRLARHYKAAGSSSGKTIPRDDFWACRSNLSGGDKVVSVFANIARMSLPATSLP